MFRFSLFLLAVTPLSAGEITIVPIEPIDIQITNQDDGLSTISQLASIGDTIYLRSARETHLLAIDRDGKIRHRLGGKGDHPAEFGHNGIMAMAIDGADLWAMDAEGARLRQFRDGRFVRSIRPVSGMRPATFTSQVFAVGDGTLVMPAPAGSEHLADVLDHEGTHLRVIDPQVPETTGAQIPNGNHTLWHYDRGHWYALFAYSTEVRVYDTRFGWVNAYQIETPVTRARRDAIGDPKGLRGQIFEPVFTDFEIHDGNLLAMSGGTLHRVDAATGRVLEMVRFQGSGPGFRETTQGWVHLPFFTVLSDGRLVLGHPAMLWNHDLWTAALPRDKS